MESKQTKPGEHYNCLIVDDETELAYMTREYFETFGVSCACVETAAQCQDFLQGHTVDILLLDINLSEESGFALCKKLREESDIPILFISARQSDDDILIALNIGGDDYIKKPYALSVLLAKVKVVLKRMEGMRQAVPATAADDMDTSIYLEEAKLCAYVKGREIPLKAREFALLKCLYEHRGAIVTKQQLFDQVWGNAFYSDGTLNVHIRRLREKLEENPNEPVYIKTIWGTGYMLEM